MPHRNAGHPRLPGRRRPATALRTTARPHRRDADEDVHAGPTGTTIQLGREPAAVPEPFVALLRAHLGQRPNLRTSNTAGNLWLFPARRAGSHLHPVTMMNRRRGLGMDLRGARNTALRALVRQVPAPIVATKLGYTPGVTSKHADLAAEPMSRYAALARARAEHQ